MNVVFEIVRRRDRYLINRYLRGGASVWIVEPFHAVHHEKGVRFFPPSLPDFVKVYIQRSKVNVLNAKSLRAEEVYGLAGEKAVEVVESLYHEYRKGHERLFEYVCSVLGSPLAENVFKKRLCERAATFCSVNTLLGRIERLLGSAPVLVYPDTNVRSYLRMKELFSRSGVDFFEHSSIRFPFRSHVAGFLEDFRKGLVTIARLCTQTLASGVLGRKRRFSGKKKGYVYGIAIVSPRQLKNDNRGPDFILDGRKTKARDLVYFPLFSLTKDQEKQLASRQGVCVYPAKVGRLFTHFDEWRKLLWLAAAEGIWRNAGEVGDACAAFFHYFRWLELMKAINIKHFITHCDFSVSHIGRNLALKQAGVQTWYFSDSISFGCNRQSSVSRGRMRHPFWSYLCYDHFVTWDVFVAEYFKAHPGSFEETHVVGCLWGGHIREKDEAREQTVVPAFKNLENLYVVSCFDSTYSKNGLASYSEGVTFAEHLLRLADECPDIRIVLKEKKDRSIHHVLDPLLGPKLIEIYNEMDAHPRITICNNRADASELISVSDMVISYPFTSTTFEALSFNRPAIWHDPMGYYQDTPYGKVGGVTTHSYDELKARVLEIKAVEEGEYKNPIPADSPLMDPYRDGKAIDRFRDLLCRHDGG